MKNSNCFKILIIFAWVSFFTATAFGVYPRTEASNKEDAQNRPKIGLVLGGGGARGAAHVGVLKVLEEYNVPIDYVIGTSMGSIVGGLYAAGMSPQEMEAIFNLVPWNDMFSDRPPEVLLPFRHKKDNQRLMAFELGVKHGKITLPKGFIPGQKLGFLLQKLTLNVANIDNFDELPIPFRAVSADLATGEAVVHDHGSLNEAMRASMSIPGVFTPVEMDGRILIDGGIVNNVPIEIARQIGADVIIAIDVGTPLSKVGDLKNMLDVTMQMIGILTQKNVDNSIAQLTEKDLFIRPELGDIGSSNFTRTTEAIKLGEKKTRQFVDKIKRYSISSADYKMHLARQRAREMKPIIINFVKVNETSRVHPKKIIGKIKTKAGEKLDTEKLQKDLNRVYAIGDFETVDFKIVGKEGEKGLLIDAKEKEWGPNYLRFGINLSANFTGDSEYTILADYRMTQLNALGAEWRTVGRFGEQTGIFSEFYQPLNMQEYFFVAPRITYKSRLEDIYKDDDRIAEYRVDYLGGGFDLGINFSSFAEGRVGLRRGTIDAKPEAGGADLPEFEGIQEGAIVAKLEYDQLDNHTFPKTGFKTRIGLFASDEDLGADFTYENLEFTFLKATTFNKKHTVITSFVIGTSLDENTPFYDQFTLGGFLSLSGLGRGQLRGQHKGLGQLLYFYRFDKAFDLVSNFHIGGGVEAGNVWDHRDDIELDDAVLSGTVFAGFDNFIAPLYGGYGRAEGTDEGIFYLFLGKMF